MTPARHSLVLARTVAGTVVATGFALVAMASLVGSTVILLPFALLTPGSLRRPGQPGTRPPPPP